MNRDYEFFSLTRIDDIPYSSVWIGEDPDLHGHPSLTNSVSDLADDVGADHIIYRDSMGNWDGWEKEKGFYSLAEQGKPTREMVRAIALALVYRIEPQFWLSQFDRMIQMQNKLNVRTAGDQWIERKLPWFRAIHMEASEAINSIPWKWWKAESLDLENLAIELVDIWHFVMSWMIAEDLLASSSYGPTQILTGASQIILNDPHGVDTVYAALRGKTTEAAYSNFALTHLERLIHLCTDEKAGKSDQRDWIAHVAIENLALMMALFPTKNMPALYFTKNWLNEHRQREGYNDPDANYKKVVIQEGREMEDNAFAREWVARNLNADKEAFFHAMRSAGFCNSNS